LEASLNLRLWSHFLVIAEAGSFTRAALQLRVAQPVLSREMAELERQLGARLFHRHARGVKLSAVGDRFRARAKDILKQVEDIPHDLADANEEPVGTLSVGMPPSMGGFITGEAVKTYRARYPASRIHLSLLAGEECYEHLVERRLDLAVIASRRGQRGVDLAPLLTDDIGVYGARHLLEGIPDVISATELARLPLMLAPAPSLIHDLLSTELTRKGLRLNIVMEGNLWATFEFVRQGVGLAIFSECAKGMFDPAIVRFVKIEVPPGVWSIATLSYRPVTPGAAAFSRILREIVAGQTTQPAQSPLLVSQA
jgi:LysR family transcriptional regulator, nitrogen assimilation regulatory protein